MSQKKPNHLHGQSSPYLKQHLYNPVDWYPFGEAAFKKAKEENKPILFSTGYSSCHWCHVMEKESFEDQAVAELMNRFFVCVKVDREERPDVDHLYMTALQLLSSQGGWPLNCFALPDGSPFWGGTYFRKDQWKRILQEIHQLFTQNYDTVAEQAKRVKEGVQQVSFPLFTEKQNSFPEKWADQIWSKWQKQLDFEKGGSASAPKFPMPDNLMYMLRHNYHSNNEEIRKFIELSLDSMATGGIYDQIGGGFARYSTDVDWKVPHFEKMLYDNAQLIKLYSQAYTLIGKEAYKDVVYDSIDFILKEMTGPKGEFYSALDADSEGVEGKYYVWENLELHDILQEDFDLFSSYYRIENEALWENGLNILFPGKSIEDFAKENNLDSSTFRVKNKKWKEILMKERDKRERPGLDNKSLCSWNALMAEALVYAYRVFGEDNFWDAGLKNLLFIEKEMMDDHGNLYHSYGEGKAYIHAFLEDYAAYANALLMLYQVNNDPAVKKKIVQLFEKTEYHFSSDYSPMFLYAPKTHDTLFSKKLEIHDNVIPSSNAMLARFLQEAGLLFEKDEWFMKSEQMAGAIRKDFMERPYQYSHWGQVFFGSEFPLFKLNIPDKVKCSLGREFLPNILFGKNEETTMRACHQKACLEDFDHTGKLKEEILLLSAKSF